MSRWVPDRTTIRAVKVAKGTELVRGVINDTLRGAKAIARRGDHRHGSGRAVAGPPLHASFGQRWDHGHELIAAEAFNTRDYSTSLALGSKPHRIPSGSQGPKRLKFRWTRGDAAVRAAAQGRNIRRSVSRSRDGYFYFRNVRHPGNKRPNRFFQTPLVMAARKRNFRVKVATNSRGFLP